jgi:hypothetical protein
VIEGETLALRVSTLRALTSACGAHGGRYVPTREMAWSVRSALAFCLLHHAELRLRETRAQLHDPFARALPDRLAHWLDHFATAPHCRDECRELAEFASQLADAIEIAFGSLLPPVRGVMYA